VSANHGAIVKFAARGAGRAGFPPVAAPLADPNATPSEAVQGAVDSALRIICAALLDGTEKQDAAMLGIAKTIVEKGDNEFATGVVDSLSYLRDRIGVPRDMKLPAARQLRAHLNWSIGKILDVQDSSA
jgi:glutathione S-transferase